MKEKKLKVATLGFEPAFQLPPAKNVRPLTTGLRNRCVLKSEKSIVLKYLFLLFTVEPYGAVFIMNSKIHLRKIPQTSISKPFRIISVFIRALYRPID